MTAFAMAHLRTTSTHDEVFEYIETIQSTMDPYGGRFVAHGPQVEVLEGSWPGTLVILEFPDLESARSWYDSPAYQAILPLRTRHIEGDTLIFPGVGPNYDARATAAVLRSAAAA
ncbi:DUF1330 domain-containing protein [Actinoplanes bogorensis]|uniref:DUF1330 domain-containing protein n=1 Tax=Paractinoplanes bogorensis TaxID=1610840 RepID=A0ABS5Z5V7_9ACTN|nr:DUF1330 domain-containing protein [Actinoplanes bogorensis]MBU2670746.1 DUF1330 domain-containing protein [Actinoplanes bogorensis]